MRKKYCAIVFGDSGCGCRANDGSEHESKPEVSRGGEQLQSRTLSGA